MEPTCQISPLAWGKRSALSGHQLLECSSTFALTCPGQPEDLAQISRRIFVRLCRRICCLSLGPATEFRLPFSPPYAFGRKVSSLPGKEISGIFCRGGIVASRSVQFSGDLLFGWPIDITACRSGTFSANYLPRQTVVTPCVAVGVPSRWGEGISTRLIGLMLENAGLGEVKKEGKIGRSAAQT